MTDAKLPGLEERFAEIKGVRMRYFLGGEGPPLILVHSLGGMIVLRMALRRPEDVPAIVLAAAAGLSIGNVWGRNMLSVFSTIRPGRLAARYRGRVTRSPLLRRLVFGLVSVADPVGL